MFCYIQIHDIQIDVQAKKQIPYLDVVKQCINDVVSLVPPEKRDEQSITSARVVLLKFGMKYDTEGALVYTLEHNDRKYEHTASKWPKLKTQIQVYLKLVHGLIQKIDEGLDDVNKSEEQATTTTSRAELAKTFLKSVYIQDLGKKKSSNKEALVQFLLENPPCSELGEMKITHVAIIRMI